MAKQTKIIHIDMDAFFAQIEQRDHPQYKNVPLIVGSPVNRGVISSASYEARKYGLHSGMPHFPGQTALSPGSIFAGGHGKIPGRVAKYKGHIFPVYSPGGNDRVQMKALWM
ncbi:MAG: hypothetical protein U5N58_00630 [Actinomycetota bacterium]|nr:hypothetical protein [Actinomycetota bacterium]